MKYNYSKLMKLEPTVLGSMINSLGQTVNFLEHPINGDDSEVICEFPDFSLAFASTFFETDDMTAAHKEYEPRVIDGCFYIGEFCECK